MFRESFSALNLCPIFCADTACVTADSSGFKKQICFISSPAKQYHNNNFGAGLSTIIVDLMCSFSYDSESWIMLRFLKCILKECFTFVVCTLSVICRTPWKYFQQMFPCIKISLLFVVSQRHQKEKLPLVYFCAFE